MDIKPIREPRGLPSDLSPELREQMRNDPDFSTSFGRGWLTVKEMLDILLTHAKTKIRTQEDPARLRPSDVPILWADTTRFHQATGWEPVIPFEQTLADLLEYWRERVRREQRLRAEV